LADNSNNNHKPTQDFLYLTTTGWKTGREHRIEIWFVEHKGNFYILSEGKEYAHWVQNIKHNSAVSFSVGNNSFTGIARIVNSNSEPNLTNQIAELMDAKYKWNEGLIVELLPKSVVGRSK
jgi:deazaflavin-dependent oxidoreductase (nitroreductase family)